MDFAQKLCGIVFICLKSDPTPTPAPDVPTPTPDVQTPTPAPANATIHIGFHDIFIEGEYLTVRSK